MLRTALIVAAAALLALSATTAQAAFQAGTWELTLNAGSTNTGGVVRNNDQNVAVSLGAGLGYYVTKDIDVTVRQTYAFSHSKAGGEGTDAGTTQVAADWNFDMGDWEPFVGGAIGASYAQHVNPTYAWAPEAGARYFLNSTTYLFGLVQYLIPINAKPTHTVWAAQIGIGVGLNTK